MSLPVYLRTHAYAYVAGKIVERCVGGNVQSHVVGRILGLPGPSDKKVAYKTLSGSLNMIEVRDYLCSRLHFTNFSQNWQVDFNQVKARS